MLGFPYPGGVYIQNAAQNGDKFKYKFTIPMDDGTPNFSFSGLKTNVLRQVEKISILSEQDKSDIAASFQFTVSQTIAKKLNAAINQLDLRYVNKLTCCGGVAANAEIRSMLINFTTKNNLELYLPEIKYCTDNASMIAVSAIEYYNNKAFNDLDFEPRSRWVI